jgi:hypothetical protein
MAVDFDHMALVSYSRLLRNLHDHGLSFLDLVDLETVLLVREPVLRNYLVLWVALMVRLGMLDADNRSDVGEVVAADTA